MIGLREKLQENPIFGKIYGFRLRFSLFCQPIESFSISPGPHLEPQGRPPSPSSASACASAPGQHPGARARAARRHQAPGAGGAGRAVDGRAGAGDGGGHDEGRAVGGDLEDDAPWNWEKPFCLESFSGDLCEMGLVASFTMKMVNIGQKQEKKQEKHIEQLDLSEILS